MKNNNDVDKIEQGLIRQIQYFQNFNESLECEDIDCLEKALAKYEIAIHKVLQCYDDMNFKYSASELLKLIENWNKYEELITNIHTKKAFQD